MLTPTWLYRHDEIVTHRPYGVEVDADDILWEGMSDNRLIGHNLRTAELLRREIPEFERHVAYSIFHWDGKLIMCLGEAPYYLVHDLKTGKTVQRPIKGTRPQTWYGCRLPDGKVLLCERADGQALILDSPYAEPRYIKCPYPGDYAGAYLLEDGLVYTTLSDPARLVRFDPKTEKFVDSKPLPWPEVAISHRFVHDGVMFGADTAGGRLLPMDMRTQRWLDPIPVPGHGEVFGFIGGGFSVGSKGYFCLSTYTARSRLDTKTGRIIVPEGKITVDGRPPRFMEKLLVFDAATRCFEFLEAPTQPDGFPLLCYSWCDGKRFAVTGILLPLVEGRKAGPEPGRWIVMQNFVADREPGFGKFEFRWNRREHLARNRRSYPRDHSLFLSEAPHTQPTVNMEGVETHYDPARDQQAKRRATRTDRREYWAYVASRMYPPGADDAVKTRCVLEHVGKYIYYNPIQVPQEFDPIAIHELHDGRCGHGTAITTALLQACGVECRERPLRNHTVAEAKYGGAWHIADALFFGADQPAIDGRVLSVEELQANPYVADAKPTPCFAYDPELLLSEDGFGVLGYVFGPWGSEPYYSYYLGAAKDYPPTIPTVLPAAREKGQRVRLRWSRSVKAGGETITYDVSVFADRACTARLHHVVTDQLDCLFDVPEMNRMYYMEVRAMDEHRRFNPRTWYPAARYNFVLVPPEQYGWYGVV